MGPSRSFRFGYVVIADAPDAFAAHIKSEIASLAKVLKDVRVE
jgi:hypothetical protein